jgi:membrane fusion protein, type I secretion system
MKELAAQGNHDVVLKTTPVKVRVGEHEDSSEVPYRKHPAALGYAIIVVTFFGLGGWSALAKIDSAVMAPGVVANEGNKRTVQHSEGGIVREIMVREGQHVQQGQVLFRIDPVQAKASYELQRNQLDFALAQESKIFAFLHSGPMYCR